MSIYIFIKSFTVQRLSINPGVYFAGSQVRRVSFETHCRMFGFTR